MIGAALTGVVSPGRRTVATAAALLAPTELRVRYVAAFWLGLLQGEPKLSVTPGETLVAVLATGLPMAVPTTIPSTQRLTGPREPIVVRTSSACHGDGRIVVRTKPSAGVARVDFVAALRRCRHLHCKRRQHSIGLQGPRKCGRSPTAVGAHGRPPVQEALGRGCRVGAVLDLAHRRPGATVRSPGTPQRRAGTGAPSEEETRSGQAQRLARELTHGVGTTQARAAPGRTTRRDGSCRSALAPTMRR